MPKKIYHEINASELGSTVSEINESLFKLYIQIATFAGHKIMGLIGGKETGKILSNLPDSQLNLQDAQFYKMGYHGIIPVYVDMSLGEYDVLVFCKGGIEKIRIINEPDCGLQQLHGADLGKSHEGKPTNCSESSGHTADVVVCAEANDAIV